MIEVYDKWNHRIGVNDGLKETFIDLTEPVMVDFVFKIVLKAAVLSGSDPNDLDIYIDKVKYRVMWDNIAYKVCLKQDEDRSVKYYGMGVW